MFFRPAGITFDAALRDLGSKDPRVRAAAATAAGDFPDTADRARAAKELERVLTDERWEVRAQAALSLGELAQASAVPALLARLKDEHAEVRQSAVIALGRLGDASAFEPLVEALREGSADVRFQAASSLVEIDPARAYDPLVDAVRDADPEVRSAVLAGLGEIGDKRAAGWLADGLDDDDKRVRTEAAFALARLHDARAVEPLVPLLDDREQAWDAVCALESCRDPRAVPGIARIVRRLLWPRLLRVRAAAALLRMDPTHAGAPAARKLLGKASRSGQDELRGLAEESLASLDAVPDR